MYGILGGPTQVEWNVCVGGGGGGGGGNLTVRLFKMKNGRGAFGRSNIWNGYIFTEICSWWLILVHGQANGTEIYTNCRIMDTL